jgi:general stress protein 26
VKIAKGAVYVRRFAAYVEDGADDPEQALMEVSNSHARYSEDSPIAPS